jgi:hypothetical protein
MSITLVDDVKKINFENKDAILNSNKKGKWNGWNIFIKWRLSCIWNRWKR